VLDLEDKFEALYNPQLIGVERLAEPDVALVQQLVYKHLENTESERAKEILGDWARFGPKFWKVRPHLPAAKPAEAHPKPATETVISERVTAANP
jgi:glutamate synthase (NADPH/NADH) large chain/glutamate synthase (ferredoxin)